MKWNQFFLICLISAIASVVVVLALKYLGYDNAVVIGGAVAGGTAAVVSALILGKEKA